MPRTVKVIRNEIKAHPARSAWERGVKVYALELIDDYVFEVLKIKDETTQIDKITEKDLLNGADNWPHYSYGGCSLCYDEEICERLCCDSEKKRTHNGAIKPRNYDNWLDMQAQALKCAARWVLKAVNRRA